MSIKWFKSLTIQNFQSHRDSHLTFIEGLNVLVGSSDAGKTAILRALKWVLYNEPSGTAFISKGAKEAKVTLEMNDGSVVSRIRSASKNQYELILPQREPLIFEGFGKQVPLEVQQATGIFPIAVGSNENHMINLAEQLEGPFLLSETGSVRATAIGKLVGVDIIDEAQKQLKRDQDQLKTREKMLIQEIQNLDEELVPFKELEDEELCFEQARNIKERLDFLSSNLLLYEKLLQDIRRLSWEEKIISDELTQYRHIEALEGMNRDLKNLCETLDRSQHLCQELTYNQEEIKHIADDLESFPIFVDIDQDLSRLKNKWNRWNQLSDFALVYASTQLTYTQLKQELENLKYLDEITTLSHQAQKSASILNSLLQLNESAQKVNAAITKGELFLQPLACIGEAQALWDDLVSLLQRLLALQALQTSLHENSHQSEQVTNILRQEVSVIQNLGKAWEETWSQAKICPWCHQPVDSSHIHQLVDTL